MHKHGMSPSHLLGLSILTGASLMLVATPASADVELAPMVVIDFTEMGYDGSGFNPEPAAGQLDSDDWSVTLSNALQFDFGETAEGNGSVFAWGLSQGGEDDGGIWAFDVDGAGLIALGVQPTNNLFTPGQIALRLANNTGEEISEFQIEYTVWINNDVNGANTFNLMQSADNETYTLVGDELPSTGPSDDLGFVANEVTVLVTPEAPIPDEAQYYLAWAGDDGAGVGGDFRDEFGLADITIRLLNVCGNGLVEKDEACDEGLANSDTGACTSTCVEAACGDGLVQEGVEECDDGNTDPDDGCSAECTLEATDTDTDTDTDGGDTESGGDTEPTGGSASDTDATMTGATMTGASMTDATMTGSGSDTDGDTGGQDDDDSGCSCRSSGSGAPVWSMLGLLMLGLVRRRR